MTAKWPMIFLRAASIAVVLFLFFFVGGPLQMLVARLRASLHPIIPMAFCRSLLWLLGMRVEVHGQPPRAAHPALLVSNHVSWTDILILASLRPVCFLAKTEVAAWPVIASFARMQDTIFIDRRRRRAIPRANADMAARLREGRHVMLFPEGTTHDGHRIGKFHSSHFQAALDAAAALAPGTSIGVQPVALAYGEPAVAAWLGDATLVPHLLSLLRHGRMTCRLIYAPTIAVAAGMDRKALSAAAAQSVAALLAEAPPQVRVCATGATLPPGFSLPSESGSGALVRTTGVEPV